ncbi:MAG: nucleotidyl transferase AbiEii/AbiGii toxin family protein [Acidobacteriota bacterium]
MDRSFYFDRLYPFQDRLISNLRRLKTGFYLTGGTAASRGYLEHRFSDDLDFFTNDDPSFGVWCDRVIQGWSGAWRIDVRQRDRRFCRLVLSSEDIDLKVELVNDVPSRVGDVLEHPVLGRLDSAQNILANKIRALIDRDEPKDLADIWGFCCIKGLSLSEALAGAAGKAAGIFPPDVARRLLSASQEDWELIKWINTPAPDRFVSDLHDLGERLVLP